MYCLVPHSAAPQTSEVLLQPPLETGNSLLHRKQSPEPIAGSSLAPESVWRLGISVLPPSPLVTDLIYSMLSGWLGFFPNNNNPKKKFHAPKHV